MIFTSMDFLAFFVVVFAVFFSLPDRWRNAWILAASYFFYGYWSVRFLCLLVFTMAFDYAVALWMQASSDERRRKRLLVSSLVVNLGILFLFKYLDLFSGLVASLAGRTAPHWDIVLPFGISFYTFHAMSYVIDVYRRVLPAERNFTHYSCYVMFFPQLVAGPIARASHLLHQFREPKRFRLENLIEGSYLIAKGYVFKVVFADTFGGYVDAYFGPEVTKTPFLVLQSVYFFAFQIYLDFFGYTLIARGIARLMDYDLVENFRTPYFATSLTDFWHRWHISLSTWLRDYLYIPLGGNRRGRARTYANLLTTMLLGGLWHGANWTFLVWGGIHGLGLAMEKAMSGTGFQRVWRAYCPSLLRGLVTFHLVCIAWIFFRATDFRQAAAVLGDCWRVWTAPWEWIAPREIHMKLWTYAFCFLGYEWLERRWELSEVYARVSWPVRFAVVYGTILFVALFRELNPKSFLYFQF